MQVIVQKQHSGEQREVFTLETAFSVIHDESMTYELWEVKDELADAFQRYMVYCFPLDGTEVKVESVFPQLRPTLQPSFVMQGVSFESFMSKYGVSMREVNKPEVDEILSNYAKAELLRSGYNYKEAAQAEFSSAKKNRPARNDVFWRGFPPLGY